MISNRGNDVVALEEGVVVEVVLNAYIVKEWTTPKGIVTLHGVSDKATNISKSEIFKPKFSNEEYQEYLRLRSNSVA